MTLTKKLLIGGAGLLGIASLFWASSAGAAPNKGGGGGGVNPPPGPFPAPPFKAIAQANTAGSMVIRDKPALAPMGKQVGSAVNGSTVTVLQTGIKPLDGSGGEWWRITNAGGTTGYARGIDPANYQNFRVA